MQLEITRNSGEGPPLLKFNPTVDDISMQLETIVWTKHTAFVVRENGSNWIEATGTDELGYTVLLADGGKGYASKVDSQMYYKLTNTLEGYSERSNNWKSFLDWEPTVIPGWKKRVEKRNRKAKYFVLGIVIVLEILLIKFLIWK